METNTRHIGAVTEWLNIEIGFVSELGSEGLYKAVIEALKNGGVLGEAGVVYIRGSGPGILREAVDIFVPTTTEAEEEPIPQASISNEPAEHMKDPPCPSCGVPLVHFALHADDCKEYQRANKQSKEDIT